VAQAKRSARNARLPMGFAGNMPTAPRANRVIAMNARDVEWTFALRGKLRSFVAWPARGWQAEKA
jgi:hypothetical protein